MQRPRFFGSSREFRDWLSKHHATSRELAVGFYKTNSRKSGMSYGEALDEALCFGWIDGVRKSIDGGRWLIRFSPRKPGSVWSLVNIHHARRLIKSGKMDAAGLAVFRQHDPAKSRIYSYEVRRRPLAAAHEKLFRSNPRAWKFFRDQAPSYQQVARWWIVRATKEETRLKRLNMLIESSARGRRLDRYVSRKRTKDRR